jgi:hypothetical protein
MDANRCGERWIGHADMPTVRIDYGLGLEYNSRRTGIKISLAAVPRLMTQTEFSIGCEGHQPITIRIC